MKRIVTVLVLAGALLVRADGYEFSNVTAIQH